MSIIPTLTGAIFSTAAFVYKHILAGFIIATITLVIIVIIFICFYINLQFHYSKLLSKLERSIDYPQLSKEAAMELLKKQTKNNYATATSLNLNLNSNDQSFPSADHK